MELCEPLTSQAVKASEIVHSIAHLNALFCNFSDCIINIHLEISKCLNDHTQNKNTSKKMSYSLICSWI